MRAWQLVIEPSATGDRRPATGDRRPATGDRRPATGDRRHDLVVNTPSPLSPLDDLAQIDEDSEMSVAGATGAFSYGRVDS